MPPELLDTEERAVVQCFREVRAFGFGSMRLGVADGELTSLETVHSRKKKDWCGGLKTLDK